MPPSPACSNLTMPMLNQNRKLSIQIAHIAIFRPTPALRSQLMKIAKKPTSSSRVSHMWTKKSPPKFTMDSQTENEKIKPKVANRSVKAMMAPTAPTAINARAYPLLWEIHSSDGNRKNCHGAYSSRARPASAWAGRRPSSPHNDVHCQAVSNITNSHSKPKTRTNNCTIVAFSSIGRLYSNLTMRRILASVLPACLCP
jgi:hypothetical protein